jgi:hypothetical protein
MDTQTPSAQPASAVLDRAAPRHRPVTDPRDLASLVITRMNVVNAKKDELSLAIHRLVEVTQQLMRTYAEQVLTIEQLRSRCQALEEAAGARTSEPRPDVQ